MGEVIPFNTPSDIGHADILKLIPDGQNEYIIPITEYSLDETNVDNVFVVNGFKVMRTEDATIADSKFLGTAESLVGIVVEQILIQRFIDVADVAEMGYGRIGHHYALISEDGQRHSYFMRNIDYTVVMKFKKYIKNEEALALLKVMEAADADGSLLVSDEELSFSSILIKWDDSIDAYKPARPLSANIKEFADAISSEYYS